MVGRNHPSKDEGKKVLFGHVVTKDTHNTHEIASSGVSLRKLGKERLRQGVLNVMARSLDFAKVHEEPTNNFK